MQRGDIETSRGLLSDHFDRDCRILVGLAGRNDAADAARCKAVGQLVPCPKPDTIADGLRGVF